MNESSSSPPPIELVFEVVGRTFVAAEIDEPALRAHARQLRDWYNAAENAAMMGGATDTEDDDVLTFVRELRRAGGRWFLLTVDGAAVGDTDLRNVVGRRAEFAIMIGDGQRKGQGLGTTFAAMLHVFAFRDLGLERIYVQPRRANVRVQRLERALGYLPDDGPEAKSHADDEDAVTMSIGAADFRARHPEAWSAVKVRPLTRRSSSG